MGVILGLLRKIQYEFWADEYKRQLEQDTAKYKRLKDLDLFILDNSLRESTVGQTRGHTIDEKWKIYEEVKKCGFKHIIVACFSNMTRVDDVFCQQLVERGEDLSNMFAFSEVTVGMLPRTLIENVFHVMVYHPRNTEFTKALHHTEFCSHFTLT